VSKSEFDFESSLNAFFEQDWVKHGDPEVLFIKRATRVGDKWNGHVALPGGKRDPEDADDQVTAAREALEEVGIDLSPDNAIAVGNLPQRIVTTSWGKVPYVKHSRSQWRYRIQADTSSAGSWYYVLTSTFLPLPPTRLSASNPPK
jgi:8-oxo-dGTP pyrophosphatase MutT (NUDIX family)